jgi:hypothetical protein
MTKSGRRGRGDPIEHMMILGDEGYDVETYLTLSQTDALCGEGGEGGEGGGGGATVRTLRADLCPSVRLSDCPSIRPLPAFGDLGIWMEHLWLCLRLAGC